MGLLFSRPKKKIYLQGSSKPAGIYRNTDFEFNKTRGIDIGRMHQRNRQKKNPSPFIIPNKRPSIQQQKKGLKAQRKEKRQEILKEKQQKEKIDQIHKKEEYLTTIVNEIEFELEKLSQEYIKKFKNNYEIMDKNVAQDSSDKRSGFHRRVSKRPSDFWTKIHENSIDKKALNSIVRELETKLDTFRRNKKKKEISKEILLDKLILKRIESSKNANIILSEYFTEKEKNIFGNGPLRNIYVNYMLFVYLIETNQIRHFVSEEFKNKIDDIFTIHRQKKNLILIKDRTETFFVHKIRFHPQLFEYFSVKKNQQQHNRS